MNLSKLTSNFYFRAAVLFSLVKFSFDNPLLLAGLVVMAGSILYMEDRDVAELKNLKNAVTSLDLSKVKSLIKSTKKDVVEVVEEPSDSLTEEVVVEKPVVKTKAAPVESKGFGK